MIEPLTEAAGGFQKLYDFDLMQGGGHVTGYLVSEEQAARLERALGRLCDKSAQQYEHPLLFAVGDGNHSLATAKACFEQYKKTHSEKEWKKSPARYALAEVVNLHDDALQFEPIHRVVFGVNPDHFLRKLTEYFDVSATIDIGQTFKYVTGDKMGDTPFLTRIPICVWAQYRALSTPTLQSMAEKPTTFTEKTLWSRLVPGLDSLGLISPQNGKIRAVPDHTKRRHSAAQDLFDGTCQRQAVLSGVPQDQMTRKRKAEFL